MNGATANLYGNTTKGKSAHFEPTAQLFNTYLDVQYDYRARDFIAATVEAGSDGSVVPPTSFKVFKYEGQSPASALVPHTSYEYSYRASTSTANWIFYRLSDIYLMKAEALAELAVTDDERKTVISLCNVTYKRATMEMDSLEYADYPSMDAVKAMVLQERQRELCFEGKRWYDLLRKVRREGATAGAYALLEKAYAREVSTYKARLSNPEAVVSSYFAYGDERQYAITPEFILCNERTVITEESYYEKDYYTTIVRFGCTGFCCRLPRPFVGRPLRDRRFDGDPYAHAGIGKPSGVFGFLRSRPEPGA